MSSDSGPVAAEPTAPPAMPMQSDSAGQREPKAGAPTPKAPATVASSPAPGAQPPRNETPAAALGKPQAPPPLDLKSLETRLKETQAIGVFTKLTLKNQIDELLDQFRAFYQGKAQDLAGRACGARTTLLVLKVLALLQDADPPLASAIAGSREAIWGILSNPAKFAAV